VRVSGGSGSRDERVRISDNAGMSHARRQGFIDAPVERVWELVADVDRHPEWWPRVVDVECEGLEEGCTYRMVTQTPFGRDEMNVAVDALDECRNLSIRCINTGTFVRFGLTEAQSGTFLEGEMGMDPSSIGQRVFDAVAGRRYFTSWMNQTFVALERAACAGAGKVGDPGFEPGTSSLSEMRSNRLS
jgi:uncharacterized protein YndB with AHSA1/START domain